MKRKPKIKKIDKSKYYTNIDKYYCPKCKKELFTIDIKCPHCDCEIDWKVNRGVYDKEEL